MLRFDDDAVARYRGHRINVIIDSRDLVPESPELDQFMFMRKAY